jgi:predicted transcriptional regulator
MTDRLRIDISLFDWSDRVRRADPETSQEAARAAGGLAKIHHATILRVLRCEQRPMAAEQIGDCCDMGHVAINRRLTELERGGLIRKTSERHRNRSGRGAFKYVMAVAQ